MAGIARESGFPLSNSGVNGEKRAGEKKNSRLKEGYFVLNQTLMGDSRVWWRRRESGCFSRLGALGMAR